jgi:hypothetical protein
MSQSLYVVGGRFDERRNTSRVFAVPAEAVDAALGLLARSRGEDWYRWIVAYGAQAHLHDAKQRDGKPAACPRRGCEAVL